MKVRLSKKKASANFIEIVGCFELNLPNPTFSHYWSGDKVQGQEIESFCVRLSAFDPFPCLFVAELSEHNHEPEIQMMSLEQAAEVDADLEIRLRNSRDHMFNYFEWKGSSLVSDQERLFFYTVCKGVTAKEDIRIIRSLRFSVKSQKFLVMGISSELDFETTENGLLSHMFPSLYVEPDISDDEPRRVKNILSMSEIAEARKKMNQKKVNEVTTGGELKSYLSQIDKAPVIKQEGFEIHIE